MKALSRSVTILAVLLTSMALSGCPGAENKGQAQSESASAQTAGQGRGAEKGQGKGPPDHAPGPPDRSCAQVFCAGAGRADMTGNVGEGQGQLSTTDLFGVQEEKFDPFFHSTIQAPTDGIQSRQYANALILDGSDGQRFAIVKADTYIPTSALTHRVAQLVSGEDPLVQDFVVPGLNHENIMLTSTHNHSAPHHVSTGAAAWSFSNTFDLRLFERMARDIASAVHKAGQQMQPARVGAAVRRVQGLQHNIIGQRTADDGSPAGFPRDYFDDELAVIRVDALESHEPIAVLVNLGLHPESIPSGSVDMISADFVGVVEREMSRALGRDVGADEGPVVVWSQGGLGDQEPESARATPPEQGNQFFRSSFAQMDRLSQRLTSVVLATWQDVALEETAPDGGLFGTGTPVPEKHVAFTDDPRINSVSYRFNGPLMHSLPTFSDCRTEEFRIPTIADCEDHPLQEMLQPAGTTIEGMSQAGVPVPDNAIAGPGAYAGFERATIHLQAFRIGDILLGAVPGEPISDMAKNFKSRSDIVENNIHKGFLYPCREIGEETVVECNFREASFKEDAWRPVERQAYQRMVAQVTNDADGWEQDFASLQGEAEPADPEDIYGNFTHRELPPSDGYRLPLIVGMSNDYTGYIVTNREFRRGDHYRKALTAYGPYTADYINTRLVAMGHEINDGPPAWQVVDDLAPEDVIVALDQALLEMSSVVLGTSATASLGLYDTVIPNDGGTPGEVLSQPAPVERFNAAQFSWQGGSNWTDNPQVMIERLEPDGWTPHATQEGGEIVVTMEWPAHSPEELTLWAAEDRVYRWHAQWEVFDDMLPGTYRYRIQGHHRQNREALPYELTSDSFQVAPWSGIRVTNLSRQGDRIRVQVAGEPSPPEGVAQFPGLRELPPEQIRYPFTYRSDAPYLQASAWKSVGPFIFCEDCSFRGWSRQGRIETVMVEVTHEDGVIHPHEARFDGQGWITDNLSLENATRIAVPSGAVRDQFGNFNGEGAEL